MLFITGHSAVELLHAPAFDARAFGERDSSLPFDFPAPTKEELSRLTGLGVRFPVEISVGDENCKISRKEAVSHFLSASTPRGSFVHFGDGIMVSAPELTFAELAKKSDLPRLLRFGYEVCGRYVKDVCCQPYGMRSRNPLTSVSLISQYLEQAKGVRGVHFAKRALRYLRDGSWSPRESTLVMLLCLSVMEGGYGLPFPVLNYKIEGSVSRGIGDSCRYGDLVWPDAKLVLEYDSYAAHAGETDIDRDSKRRAELELRGYKVLTCTNAQLLNPIELERLARLVAREVGHRLRFERISAYDNKRCELRAVLLGAKYAK